MQEDHEHRMPGHLIQVALEQRGWSNRTLALVLGVDESRLNKLIAGTTRVDAEWAIQIGEALGVEPERLLSLQAKFDLAKARLMERPDPGRVARAALFGDLPIAAMVKRGWLQVEDVRDTRSVERALLAFFEVDSLSEIRKQPHAAKRSNPSDSATPEQLSWLFRVKQIASRRIIEPYSESALRSTIREMRELLADPRGVSSVPKLLDSCGVRLVVVEAMPRSKIDGVCFWLGTDQPVVGVSMRFDRIDNFWFVLRHELEHVLHRHGDGAVMWDTDLANEDEAGMVADVIAEEEAVANAAAADFCVPKAKMDSWFVRKNPFFSEIDLVTFARMQNVHPGLVAGQLAKRTGKYKLFQQYLIKVRAMLTATAVVDGWGEQYPA